MKIRIAEAVAEPRRPMSYSPRHALGRGATPRRVATKVRHPAGWIQRPRKGEPGTERGYSPG